MAEKDKANLLFLSLNDRCEMRNVKRSSCLMIQILLLIHMFN